MQQPTRRLAATSSFASNASDVASENELLGHLKRLPTDDSSLVRVFQHPDGSSKVLGETALLVATILFKTHSVLTYINDGNREKVPVCTLNETHVANLLRELLWKRQHRAEIWAKSGSIGSGFSTSWQCIQRASPGNYQEVEELLNSSSSSDPSFDTDSTNDAAYTAAPILASVFIKLAPNSNIEVGVAFADITSSWLGYSHFVDNDLLANFESALIQVGVRECIVAAGASTGKPELARIREILEKAEIVMTELDSSLRTRASDYEDTNHVISRLMKPNNSTVIEGETSLLAMRALLSYLQPLNQDSNLGTFELRELNLSQYMRLDSVALKALAIFPFSSGTAKSATLFGLVDRCKTLQGSRLLNQWIRQPLLSVGEIDDRLDLVEAFVDESDIRQSIRETVFRGVPDLNRILRKLIRGNASLQDLVVLYQVASRLSSLRDILSLISANRKVHVFFIEPLEDIIKESEKYTEMVVNMIDMSALARHQYVVRADFDEELLAISAQQATLLSELDVEFHRVARTLGLEASKKIKLEQNNVHGYFLRVSRLDAEKVNGKTEFIQVAAQKNGVYFVTAKIRELGQRYTSLCEVYKEKQSFLVKKMLGVASTYRPVFEKLNEHVGKIDALLSLAHVAATSLAKYARPKILPMGSGELKLMDARHPCVEIQDGVSFIPNDVHFNQEGRLLQIITGPNMGGKSTYIRSAALIILLAQIGSFVPCSGAEIPVFDTVMVRVGAGDNQLRGLSTFMTEMMETASILRSATKNSFVIVDELGRGTSTSDGLGLAWGISKYIIKEIGCYCFFATHFHELTVLADELAGITNLQVTVHVTKGKLSLLYKVCEGACDESFGIHVAELAQFPRAVVEMAKIRVADLEGRRLDVGQEELKEGLAFIHKKLQDMRTEQTADAAEEFNDLKGFKDLSSTPLFIQSLITG